MKEIPFFENGLWCLIILHTIGSLVGHMCHTIIQWMLGRAACEITEISLFGYLAVCWKESFCAVRRHFIQHEAETRKVMPSLILDSLK